MDPRKSFLRGSAANRVRVAVAVICLMLFMGLVTTASAAGAIQISGEGLLDGSGSGCDVAPAEYPDGFTPDYAFPIDGDLEGCLYVMVESWACSPSGTYRERGQEFYDIIGGDLDKSGTFMTNYVVSGKWAECPITLTTPEIFGRCQHPLIPGSGTGDFEGATGRLDFKDFPDDNYFPYRGHLRW